MKIAIIGIGTELTMGQILNSNAQWISKKVYDLGIPTSCHLTVPDDRALITQALDFCQSKADILFITGGLGPTSDDFTREVIAQWCQLELQFDSTSWEHIQHRLQARGVTVRESQKQQCYYPRGAKILTNKMGTAHGFAVDAKNLRIFVLPGPPKEIESIWQDHIGDDLKELFKNLDPWVTVAWDTQGAGESEVAYRFESATQGCPYSVAYRVHLPYVEVKLTYLLSQAPAAQPWIDKIELALQGLIKAKYSLTNSDQH